MHLKWFVCINLLWYAFDSHVKSHLAWILIVFFCIVIVVECCTQCNKLVTAAESRLVCFRCTCLKKSLFPVVILWYRDIVVSFCLLDDCIKRVSCPSSYALLTIVKYLPRRHQIISSPSSNAFLTTIKCFPRHHQMISSPLCRSVHQSISPSVDRSVIVSSKRATYSDRPCFYMHFSPSSFSLIALFIVLHMVAFFHYMAWPYFSSASFIPQHQFIALYVIFIIWHGMAFLFILVFLIFFFHI